MMKMETGNLEGTRLVQHVRQSMCCGTCIASVVVLLSSTGNTELPNKFDVVRVDLQPSEQYKSVRPVVHTASDGKLGRGLGTRLHITTLHVHSHTCTHKMVLAGLRPEVIMEICSRAVSFWTYQVSTRTHNSKVCLYLIGPH